MLNETVIKIGTRKSKLALWQAHHLQDKMITLGIASELVLIDSEGDLDQESNLQNFNQTGIFTKALDVALLNGKINLAIHSLKDYPTNPPKGINVTSIGERENPLDVLVKNNLEKTINESIFKIGTGSIRRRAQWKYKYPKSQFHNLRGNVPTRLEKLKASEWDGIIMAYAGLKRLELISEEVVELQWMIPAPAQGVLGVTFRTNDEPAETLIKRLQNPDVEMCASAERRFLNKLEGGCSAPIGALATVSGDLLQFKGSLHDPDGSMAIFVNKTSKKENALQMIDECVWEVLDKGGDKIMKKIKFQ